MALLTAELIAPLAALTFSVADRTPLEADLTAPAAVVDAQTGHAFVLDAPVAVVGASISVPAVIEFALTAPAGVVEASAATGASGGIVLLAPVPTVDAWTGSQIVLLAGVPVVEASGMLNTASGFYLSAPAGVVEAAISVRQGLVADLTAPVPYLLPEIRAEISAPVPRLLAHIEGPQTDEFEAYAMNLRSTFDDGGFEVTHFSNYPFTQIVRFGNKNYGVAADGLYLLRGETDNGQPIRWALQTPTLDFSSSNRKTPVSCTMGGNIEVPVTFTVYTGEQREDSYQYTSSRKGTAQNHRQVFGRGLRERYYAFRIEGEGRLNLDDLTFDVNILTRSI